MTGIVLPPGITRITSGDGSVTVTNPTGPTVGLSVPAPVVLADARHYGYGTFEIFRPGTPDFPIYDVLDSIVGTKTNGATIANLYNWTATWTVNANDYISLFFQNQSGAIRTGAALIGFVQDSGGNVEQIQGATTFSVANGSGVAIDFQHRSGSALLDYTTPTKPFFKAGGQYGVLVGFRASFWT